MPSKCTSNDLDLVEPTQYNVQPNHIAKTRLPKPWPLPDFNPFHINDFEGHSQPNLPPDIERSDPFALYSINSLSIRLWNS
jgi:hypothetical protein